jgi:hypothetical protein
MSRQLTAQSNAYYSLALILRSLDFGEVDKPHVARRFAASLETRMAAGNAGPRMEQQADVRLASRIERKEVVLY